MNNTRNRHSSGRILLVAPLPPPIGGDTVSSARLLESECWDRAGFEIECINTSADRGVKLVAVKRSWRDPLRALRILCRLLMRLPRTDILLLWANSSFICSLGIPVMITARIMRKPYLVKIFGAMLPERIDGQGHIRRKIVKGLLGKARYILPQTKMLEKELVTRTGLDPERIVQFPNFLPASSFAEGYEKKRFSGECVFIGQIKSEKGVFDIIEALRGRDDLSCDFFGPVVERDRKRFLNETEASRNCRYAGMLAKDKIMETLVRYDVLLLPTKHEGEGYPAVILEAFAAGIPVITTDWKSIPELVKDGKRGILIPADSPDRLSAALDLLSGNEMLYASLAANAHEYVGRFSEEIIVGELLTGLVSDSIR